MTLRRFIFWLLVVLFVVVLAGAWYARIAWEQWQQANSIGKLEWQAVDVSLAGVQLQDFTVSQMRGGEAFRAEGKELSLGWSWHWHGPELGELRVGLLTVDIPAWPGFERQGEQPAGIPSALPVWLPQDIRVDRLVLTLPDSVRAEGDLAVSQLSVPDERALVTNAMKVEAPTPAMTLAGWKFHQGRAGLVFAGTATEKSATLSFSDEAYLEIARVDAPDNTAQLDNVRVSLADMKLTAGYSLQPAELENLVFEGPVEATAGGVQHPQLHPQTWRLDGRLEGSLVDVSLGGMLSSDAGVSADVTFGFPFDGIPELDAEMSSTGAKGNRAMAGTFTAWPGELEIGEGSIRTTLALRFPKDGLRVQGEVGFDGLSGLFARTAWTGLDGKVAVDLAGDHLDASTSGLAVATVNPGIALSKLWLAGGYRSTTEEIATGTLTLGQATAEFLGGNLLIEPGEWKLSDMPLRFPLELSGIELSQLMQVYPAEGLAGSGILRGTIPLRVSEQGISIDSGKVEAQAPGGTLKLPADRLRDMAQNNEAMALVVQAMENFNYTVLNSTVDYGQDGKLILGLRLEGSSPEVREGHPIVLNINLEEDIPALLTSLQLSGRVNEAVTEKVRNLIQNRDARGESTGSGN